jgi:hypothetical protein
MQNKIIRCFIIVNDLLKKVSEKVQMEGVKNPTSWVKRTYKNRR